MEMVFTIVFVIIAVIAAYKGKSGVFALFFLIAVFWAFLEYVL